VSSVPAFQQRVDHRLLAGTERVEAEDGFQNAVLGIGDSTFVYAGSATSRSDFLGKQSRHLDARSRCAARASRGESASMTWLVQ